MAQLVVEGGLNDFDQPPAAVRAGFRRLMAELEGHPVVVVDDFDEGVRRAADDRYGLAATVLSGSLEHITAAVDALPVGTVKVNAVFGGAPGGAAHPRRASGHGYGYGPELLDELTATKVVHIEPAP